MQTILEWQTAFPRWDSEESKEMVKFGTMINDKWILRRVHQEQLNGERMERELVPLIIHVCHVQHLGTMIPTSIP